MHLHRSFLPLLVAVLLIIPVHSLSAPLPAIDVTQAEFDFGEVFQGEKVAHVFSFANSGDAPLLIDRVKSSCGCTAVLLSSKEIAPGESGTIKATFDSSRFRGAITKVIYLYSNAPGHETTRFAIKGKVKPVVDFNPQQISFGEVKEGAEKQLSVVLINASEKDLQIQNIRASNTAISATTEAKLLRPGVETEFTVFARPVKETPHLRGYVLVRTDNASLGEIRVPVQGYIARPAK